MKTNTIPTFAQFRAAFQDAHCDLYSDAAYARMLLNCQAAGLFSQRGYKLNPAALAEVYLEYGDLSEFYSDWKSNGMHAFNEVYSTMEEEGSHMWILDNGHILVCWNKF